MSKGNNFFFIWLTLSESIIYFVNVEYSLGEVFYKLPTFSIPSYLF